MPLSTEIPVNIIVVAAGAGSRFGSSLPKQFCLLAGRPVVMHTIDRLRQMLPQGEITLVISQQMQPVWDDLCQQHDFRSPTTVYGGPTRYHSVKNAIDSIDACRQGIVMVHDAARPLVNANVVESLLQAINEGADGAIPCVGLVDSIRTAPTESTPSQAADRSAFVAVQTPQAFPTAQLRDAYNRGFSPDFTDDASVSEAAGYSNITIVEGDPRTLKITHPADLHTVTYYLQGEDGRS